MKRTTFDVYVTLHRLMWLNMCQKIAKEKHPIDIYTFKRNWIYTNTNKTHAINSCFLCECANILRDEADDGNSDSMLQHTLMGLSCRYCPCVWPSNGDDNHQYMCEYNFHFEPLAGWDTRRYGLWSIADNIGGEYADLYDINDNLSMKHRRMVDKMWKKQCKICFKIAMLPVRNDLDHLIIESL